MDEETQRVEETRAGKRVRGKASKQQKRKGFEHAGAGKKEAAGKTKAKRLFI